MLRGSAPQQPQAGSAQAGSVNFDALMAYLDEPAQPGGGPLSSSGPQDRQLRCFTVPCSNCQLVISGTD